MEQDDEEKEFQRVREKRQQSLRGIIAITGPPYTRKTALAKSIRAWANCPALCIQHLLPSTPSDRGDVVAKKNAVDEAFTSLCKVAQFHLSPVFYFSTESNTVVIKSRFSSTFELQRLFDLTTPADSLFLPKYPILFIECRFTNEYLWKEYFEEARNKDDDESRWWYRPGSWEEMEQASRDYDSQSHHLITQLQLLHQQHRHIRVRRLVVDPVDDIFTRSSFRRPLPTDFTDAIKYLLTTPQCELPQEMHPCINNIKIDYVAVRLRELRPILFEKRVMARLAAANGRTTHTYCPGGECVFQYIESDQPTFHHYVGCCGVCGKQVVDSSSASSNSSYYACRLCILTLHKPCAERLPFNALSFSLKLLLEGAYFHYYHEMMPEKHACKSCSLKGGFDENCDACQWQTHLKCGLLPTIIHHDSHPPHFLSLLVTYQDYRCSACGEKVRDFSYSCRPCGLYYHLECALLPLQLLRHNHGGHEHVMRLLYSHHDTDENDEEEESYWCDICGKNMDPHNWCYSCKDCPYYSAHLKCARGYKYLRSNVKNSVFVPQIQSQLEAAMAEVSFADSETPSESEVSSADSETPSESD